MGLFSAIAKFFAPHQQPCEVLVLGLDNSGKTSILNQLKPPDNQLNTVVPTVGYNVEKFSASNIAFTAYDMSGQSKYRNLWETQFKACNAIIFVVDSSDKLRMAVARDELWMILDHKDIKGRKIPILVFANKSDLARILSEREINITLGLDVIRQHNWRIERCSALSGQGLVAGIGWLSEQLKLNNNDN
ncbi:unnamed protein product [Bursaphelenchus okinawaensis]|uniref:ADP-ribosylation factor-like protein 6 n=1 Tax=Bursaphelenchus okinawaensis TaxID=465554 RepID=A0A811KM92_9BILA|nr:unnamed protein product [Bursaphelenchus okinawaensis]CAG9106257.1 unnamed protein product [Bursaphelenchus okinawaensis]